MKKVRHIISFGAGLNSAGMLALLKIKKIKIDLALMADPGAEEPETYEWIKNYAMPYFERNNIPFMIIQSKLGNIYDHHYKKKIIPFVSRRSCTDHFKIRPIKEYIKNNFSDDVVFCYIGYDADEPQRAKSRNLPYIPVYPLIQYGITRSRCSKLAQSIELYPPEKSRCFFCPFKKKLGFIKLYQNHRELYEKAMKLEQNNKQYPKATLLNNTKYDLEKLMIQIENQLKLYAYVPINHALITDQRIKC